MKAQHLIAATDFCVYHHVDYTFITSLEEAGLVTVTVVDETTYIPGSELKKLEKLIRMHHELEINVPGIEAIIHLLERIENMQEDMRGLKNKLRRYDAE